MVDRGEVVRRGKETKVGVSSEEVGNQKSDRQGRRTL